MVEHAIIRLHATNYPALIALFGNQSAGCSVLHNPDIAAAEAFLANERRAGNTLQPFKTGHIQGRPVMLYARNAAAAGQFTAALAGLQGQDESAHKAAIATLGDYTLVEMDAAAGKIKLHTDPFSAQDEIAVFFRPRSSEPWSIAYFSAPPKMSYLRDLLLHDATAGLEAQLSIYTFHDGTEVLARNYLFDALDSTSGEKVGAVTKTGAMYILRNGMVETALVPEDFLLHEFKLKHEWEDEFAAEHGPFTVTNLTTADQAVLCEPFVNGLSHFTVYKTLYTRDAQTIDGNYYQRDAAGNVVIQQSNQSVLEPLLRNFIEAVTIPRATLQSPHAMRGQKDFTAQRDKWLQRKQPKNNHAYDAQETPEGVRVKIDDNTYLIDQVDRLTLHGEAKAQGLEAMLQHAREEWGGRFQITEGDEATRRLICRMAWEQGLEVTNYPKNLRNRFASSAMGRRFSSLRPVPNAYAPHHTAPSAAP